MSVNGAEIPLHADVGDNFYFNPGTLTAFPVTVVARNTEGDEASLVISSAGDIFGDNYLDFDALL